MYSARRRGASGTPLKPGMLVVSTTYGLPPLCTTVTPKRSIPSAAPRRRVMSTSSASGVNAWPSYSRWVRAGDAHREIALVFEDVEIVVDADPRQLDQLVTEMHRLGGGAPRSQQPDDFRHVALIGGRVSSHQQSDPHSISFLARPPPAAGSRPRRAVTSLCGAGKSHTNNDLRARRHLQCGHGGVAPMLRRRYAEKRLRFEARDTVAAARRIAPTTQLGGHVQRDYHATAARGRPRLPASLSFLSRRAVGARALNCVRGSRRAGTKTRAP